MLPEIGDRQSDTIKRSEIVGFLDGIEAVLLPATRRGEAARMVRNELHAGD